MPAAFLAQYLLNYFFVTHCNRFIRKGGKHVRSDVVIDDMLKVRFPPCNLALQSKTVLKLASISTVTSFLLNLISAFSCHPPLLLHTMSYIFILSVKII